MQGAYRIQVMAGVVILYMIHRGFYREMVIYQDSTQRCPEHAKAIDDCYQESRRIALPKLGRFQSKSQSIERKNMTRKMLAAVAFLGMFGAAGIATAQEVKGVNHELAAHHHQQATHHHQQASHHHQQAAHHHQQATHHTQQAEHHHKQAQHYRAQAEQNVAKK